MESIPKDNILEFFPDTLEVVRKEFNFSKPDEIKDAVRIIREWLKSQRHLKKKDFADHYLEATLMASKGSVERAKNLLDSMCTLRTLLPKFFDTYEPRRFYTKDVSKVASPVILPKLTSQYHRVYLEQTKGNFSTSDQFMRFYKFCILMTEYCKLHDYVTNIQLVFDLTHTNILKIISVVDIVELRQALTILMDGFGLRIKGIHFITESKAVEALLAILKQILKPKLVGRVQIHKTVDTVCDVIGRGVLPSDLGGAERPIAELHEKWLEVLSSDDFQKYVQDLYKGGTDESLRASDKFNENYSGMPGTFRVLTLD